MVVVPAGSSKADPADGDDDNDVDNQKENRLLASSTSAANEGTSTD